MAIEDYFVWGSGGSKLTPEQIATLQAIEARRSNGIDVSPVGSWTQGAARVADAIAGAFRRGRLDRAEKDNSNYNTELLSGLGVGGTAGATSAPASSGIPMSGGAGEVAATTPGQPINMDGNQVFGDFINTVKTGDPEAKIPGITNPYGLAAVAATGRAESGFSPKNANRTWSDPSASGQPGTAGGIMSWRGPRYEALAATGDLSPAGQGKFFLRENPQLITALNNAKSLEEAQGLMNRAWAFRGYDQPGGESARRLAYANSFLPQFQGQGGGQEVASLDPAAGMPQPPQKPYVDPQVTTAYAQPAPAAETPAAQAIQQQAPALPPPVNVATPPVPPNAQAPVPQQAPQQVAQATPPALTANPAMNPAILRALTDPRATPQTRAVAEALLRQQQAQQQLILEQRLKQSDPGYQADLRLKNLQADQIANPRISPTDQANIDLNKDKFSFEKEQGSLTPDIKEYNFAKQNGYTGSFAQYQLDLKKASANNTNINTGEGNKFYNTLDEKNATIFSNLSDAGIQGRSKLGQIDQLDKLLQSTGTGYLAVLKQKAGDIGINTEGLSDIQAASALLSKMIPEQRQPGSGPVSDADLAGFRNSLPRLINQPGGNATIINTMRALTQYQIDMGAIADKVANREITPAEGRSQIANLSNPLANFQAPEAGKEEDGWKELAPGVRVRKVN